VTGLPRATGSNEQGVPGALGPQVKKVTVPVGASAPTLPVTVAVSVLLESRRIVEDAGESVNVPSDPQIHVSARLLGVTPPGSPRTA